jgi:N-sulfoglucosamine sulfohydrolase
MRAVQDAKYCYIFNPWSNGKRKFKAESMRGLTFRAMEAAANTGGAVAERVRMFRFRVREELYDVDKDPNCLVNLIDDPEHQAALNRLRGSLAAWMLDTGDRAISAFNDRSNNRECNRLVRFTKRGKRRFFVR